MRILLANSQHIMLSAIKLLMEQYPNLSVVSEVNSSDELLEQLKVTLPDLLILDWELFGNRLPELLHSAIEFRPLLFIVVLSSRMESRKEALEAGANYFVSKGDPLDELLRVLNKCCR